MIARVNNIFILHNYIFNINKNVILLLKVD